MKNFVVKTIANAAALAVAVWLIDKITLTGDSTGKEIGTLILVALIFGVVNSWSSRSCSSSASRCSS